VQRQLDAQLSGPLMEAIDDVIDSLAAGQTVDPLPELMGSHPVVAAMFRATVQPYLISWFRYDPAAVLAGVAAPVLIVQGLNDLQVGIEDAERLVGANPHARRLLIDGMNHVLKRVPDDRAANIAAYSRPDLDLAPHLMPALVSFLRRDEAVDRKGVA
jgi:hypothetical protein